MRRYFIYLAYNGKNYCGWQVQPNGMTIQQRLEESLSTLLRQQVSTTGAGRTDSGVHASLMVAHIDLEGEDINLTSLSDKLNRILPPDIVIQKTIPVANTAHARFDALSRTYKYYLTEKKDPFLSEFFYKVSHSLDYDAMNNAAKILFNYTDFTSFSKLHTDAKTNNCTIMQAEWEKENGNWVFTIRADRFLRNMVRAIVGTLLEVGRKKLTIEGFKDIIESKNRGKAGTSVPGHALFLVDIEYPESVFKPT